MREPNLAEDRPARYREVALTALARLSGGETDAATVHRARTNLRRLQAYFELVGEDRPAASIARCVTRLSKLRALQVLAHYLKTQHSPRSDRKAVRRRLRARRKQLARDRVYAGIERIVRRQTLPSTPTDLMRLTELMQAARNAHADALRRFITEAGPRAKRKALHRIRLLIKSIRYQEEWALGRPFARPVLIRRLKHAQRVLGNYEDFVHFRKLARSLNLRSLPAITKAWRKARARARALPATLWALAGQIAGSPVLLVGNERR